MHAHAHAHARTHMYAHVRVHACMHTRVCRPPTGSRLQTGVVVLACRISCAELQSQRCLAWSTNSACMRSCVRVHAHARARAHGLAYSTHSAPSILLGHTCKDRNHRVECVPSACSVPCSVTVRGFASSRAPVNTCFESAVHRINCGVEAVDKWPRCLVP